MEKAAHSEAGCSNDFTWKRTGAWLSIACAIHCLAMPFVISFLPWLAGGISETAELILIASAVVIGTITLYHDYRRHHGSLLSLIILAIGIVFIIGGHYGLQNTLAASFIAPAGGLLIFTAYVANWRLKGHRH